MGYLSEGVQLCEGLETCTLHRGVQEGVRGDSQAEGEDPDFYSHMCDLESQFPLL